MDIQKRFDRVVAIFLQLQSKSIVKAQDLADRFAVSLRTIYRDIRTLENAGVPIYSEAGIGYKLMETYKLPPTIFTKEEALSFVTAEKLMHNFLDKKLADDFNTALQKMKAVLKSSEKELIDSADKNVIFERENKEKFFNVEVPDALNILLHSISIHKQIIIQYQKSSNDFCEERIVEPVGLFLNMGYWYFFAYCHLRQDYRQFRLDRVKKIIQTKNEFQLKHKDLAFYLNKNKEQHTTFPIKINISKSYAKYLSWERDYFGFVKEEDCNESIVMYFECHENARKGFVRWFVMFGDNADILEPENLKSEIKDFLMLQLKKYI